MCILNSWLYFITGELRRVFKNNQPKLIFCQTDKVSTVKLALEGLHLDCKVMSYDKNENDEDFQIFLEKYGTDVSPADFK